MAKDEPLPIAIDTREQLPLTFESMGDRVVTERVTVPLFDYALMVQPNKSKPAFPDPMFAVEHKNPSDFISSFTTKHGLEQEAKKIRRAKDHFYHNAPIIYVVDCYPHKLKEKQYYKNRASSVSYEWVATKISEAIFKFNIIPLWCKDRADSEFQIYKLLKSRKKMIDAGVHV